MSSKTTPFLGLLLPKFGTSLESGTAPDGITPAELTDKAMHALMAEVLPAMEKEVARLGKEQIAPQEIEKKRIEIAAEAEAEKLRREAQGQADATLAKYKAEDVLED